MSQNYKVDHRLLEEFVSDIFKKYKVSDKNAKMVSKALVDADLRNVISHGVMRVGNYVDRIVHGGATINPNITVVNETPTTALIDGDDGLGAIVSEFAVKMAREKAKQEGLSFITVRRSNHFGAAARWAIKLSGDDMIGFTGSNVAPTVCITGGKSKGIGNNPFSYAFPTKSYGHVCLDVACSVMAAGKMVAEYKLKGKKLPVGSYLDKEGNSTIDPEQAVLMMPFGGHKGYGLAVVVEMFTSILSGGNFGDAMGSQYGILDKPNHISHFFLALNIGALRDINDYKENADSFFEYLHNLPKSDGIEKIYVPGELENISRQIKCQKE